MIAGDAASQSKGAASQKGSAVEIRDVVCQFGRIRALDGLSLDVKAGTVREKLRPIGASATARADSYEGRNYDVNRISSIAFS